MHRITAGSARAATLGERPKSAALLVDDVFPEQPARRGVLGFPYPLRFLFSSRPEIMGRVLGIVYCVIATHQVKQAVFTRETARTGAANLIQRFGSALKMLFLDGVYDERPRRFAPAPSSESADVQ